MAQPAEVSNVLNVADVGFFEHLELVGLHAQQELDVGEVCALDMPMFVE